MPANINRLVTSLAISLVWTVILVAAGPHGAHLPEECGTRSPHLSRPQPRIFRGRDAPTGAWPWLGRIDIGESFYCHTVLISRHWALAELDCVIDENSVVIFGVTDQDDQSSARQEFGILRVYTNPEAVNAGPNEENQLTMIRLDNPANITDYVRPICINRLVDEWDMYENCWIAGWGDLNNYDEEKPRILQEAPSGVLTPEVCRNQNAAIGKPIHDSEICGLAGGNADGLNNPRACTTERGAPMMCSNDNQNWYVVGLLTSQGFACGNNTSIYTRVSYQTEFIDAIINRVAACEEPDYLCSDGITCVFPEELCDGTEQCPAGDDEVTCEVPQCMDTTCRNGGTCTDNEDGYTCECPIGWSGIQCETVDCGENISIPIGTAVNLSSPFYPNDYPGRLQCEWTVTAPEGYKVLVEFMDVDLQVSYDFLYLNDTYFSADPGKNFTSSSEILDIRLTSDPGVAGRGFLLKLSAVDVAGVDECSSSPCYNDATCTDETDGFSCQCQAPWAGRICYVPDEDQFCGDQDVILAPDTSRNITSFDYPNINSYRARYRCKVIITAPPGRKIYVDFQDLGLYPAADILYLNNYIFTGFETPNKGFISDGNHLELGYYNWGTGISYGFHVVVSDYLPPGGDECISEPCQNGGQCLENDSGFTCKCRRGFTGKFCQTGLSRCGRNHFQCKNGRCIKASDVCDRRNNCGDGSDEVNCECEFHCYNRRCIPQRYVCDTMNNCGDWTDELRPNC
ncbi:uncharacterized protein [Amphiura filiformis]|uniref:uncharacterized protein n=1 Tax=Amphiura filiformis TaxID=82378 RepID=UPI003B212834